MKRHYIELGEIIRVFLGQDSDAFGDTLEEVVDAYVKMSNDKLVKNARKQIQQLLDNNDDAELNSKLIRLAEGEFDPATQYGTWRNFLTKLKDLLPEN